MSDTVRRQRVGLFGGSFDPPHLGHVRAAEAFEAQAELDEIVVLPAPRTPKKVPVADGVYRLEMLKRTFSCSSAATRISDYELRRQEICYTADTVATFARAGRQPVLLLGSDAFLGMEKWVRCAEIFRVAEIAVMCRNDDRETVEKACERYKQAYGARVKVVDCPALEASSSEIRAAIAKGQMPDRLLSPGVIDYITYHRLYGWPEGLEYRPTEEPNDWLYE